MSAGRMHADEFDIDVPLVRRLVAARFPRWADLPVERFPSDGTCNAMFRLGDGLAARLPLAERMVGDVEFEHRWLPRLAPLLPVDIPTVVGEGLPTEDFPWTWSVHRWLDGANPVVGGLADPAGLATDLAAFIAAMRRIELADGPAAHRCGPLATEDVETRTALGELNGVIDTRAATAAWEAALEAPDWSGPPVWVHSDLMPSNMLVDRGRLSAVIDFATAGVGDPACDLIVAWNLLPAQVRDRFRTAVGADDATWARGRGWALSMALIQLPYYQHTNPGIAANARHVIREVLADHERRPGRSG